MKIDKEFLLGRQIISKKYCHIIILYFCIFHFINCNSHCNGFYAQDDLNNGECFNNVIKFDNKKYRANNFATNKKGDLLLELTELKEDNNNEFSSSRLFYGITKGGYPFFKNNTSFTSEIQINKSKELFDDNNCTNLNNINNSINLFISLENDLNKEYLFSINSHNCMVELFDINEDNNNIMYYLWNFQQFFNLNSSYYLSFNYDLFELGEKNEYIIAFIPDSNITEKISNSKFIIKFRFKSFDENAYDEINIIDYSSYLNSRIINVILLNSFIAVLTNKTNDNKYQFNLNLYDLEFSSSIEAIKFNTEFINKYKNGKFFIKSLLMNENVFFIYIYKPISSSTCSFLFELYNFNDIELKTQINIKIKSESVAPYYFDINKSLYDIIKYGNTKVAFIYTSFSSNDNLLRDLENDDNKVTIYLIRIDIRIFI